ncbi:hypothetical protein COO60DRAFT_1642034 [Scenedesmus sp. NREL 46B-D3]|nr:hypothetical protein COO60DRAFT_1642034 [Scenedesmus sp. NREL 46B-D3]
MARIMIVAALCLLIFSNAAAGRILLQGAGSAGPGSSGSGFNSGGSGISGTGTGDVQRGSGGTTMDMTAAADMGTDTNGCPESSLDVDGGTYSCGSASAAGTSTTSGVTGDTTDTTAGTGTGTTSGTGTSSSIDTTAGGTSGTSTGGNSGGSSGLVSGGAATGDRPTQTNSDIGGAARGTTETGKRLA